MTSSEMQQNPLFLRNEFETFVIWNIPIVRKNSIHLEKINLLACSDTKKNDSEYKKQFGVHFFVDDYRFDGIYRNPEKTLKKYSQYKFLLTPDFSLYANMPLWLQLSNVAKNRWVGAYWQSKGLNVIPTISWSTAQSFKFCFDGVENGSIVAISTVGCLKARLNFMRGYDRMLEKINPKAIICYGKTFSELYRDWAAWTEEQCKLLGIMIP